MPALFENRKKCPDFGKKDPDYVHPWVKLSIQAVPLRVSSRKNFKMFACWGFFSCVFDEMFIEGPEFHKPPLCPEKFLVAHLYSGNSLLVKRSILNVWHCSEYVCLVNCSLISTMALSYVLHQTHSEFWHIRIPFAYSGIFAVIFSHIQLY